MRILSIQQIALTPNSGGTEVPLVFENGVFYKIFGNGFESAPFNHDSDNVNFLPVGQGYPTTMLGVITDGKLKLYTTYAPVDYVQLLEFADDSYTMREEVRTNIIDLAEINKLVFETHSETFSGQCTLSVQSVTHADNGDITLTCSFDRLMNKEGTNTGPVIYVEAFGRKYYPILTNGATLGDNVTVTGHTTYANVTFERMFRFATLCSHDDYS